MKITDGDLNAPIEFDSYPARILKGKNLPASTAHSNGQLFVHGLMKIYF